MSWFDTVSDATVKWSGSATAVFSSIFVVAIWAAFGPIYEWSEGHQLVINTGTTIVTFWLAFIILHAQNKDTAAVQAKLDELIRSSEARNEFIALDKRTEAEIEAARSCC